MIRFTWLTVVIALAYIPNATPQEAERTGSTVTLDGVPTRVRWSDGDSFQILEGEHQGSSVRIAGYNALESYGPVHRWGEWSAAELYEISGQATQVARAGSWSCVVQGAPDRYGRLLVRCDDLTLAMVSGGLGLLLCMDGPCAPPLIEAQQSAQTQGLGMWAKGVPQFIVTSLHSATEGDEPYNRVVSTTDGTTEEVTHSERYETCQEVCLRNSCLLYVPFEQRYGRSRASCLVTHLPQEETAP
ncbi:MAG: thermonuclease family protein [Bradymonadales bacterium]|nr:thermonuclease family protein [Bradymonadales bacterium]